MRTYLVLFTRQENLFLPCLYVSASTKADVSRWLADPRMHFWRGWVPSIHLAELLTAPDVTLHPGGQLASFTPRARKLVRAMQEIAKRDDAALITVEVAPSIEEAVRAKPSLRLTR